MTMFDSSRYDISTLIEKLRDQRFDGYDAGMLAREVEKFHQGTGTASMGDAVAALKSVVNSLAGTDATLRKQLSTLGVTWQSESGGQASAVLTEQAGFAGQAFDNVSQAAQLIFEQGEAFNRTKNKLPDPETLRQGEDGHTLMDTVFSLFGFETDHASEVKANAEARAQAVEALNSYAHDSGEYLASSQAVPEPQALNTTPPPPPAAGGPGIGTPDQTSPVPDLAPTAAASSKGAYPAHSSAPASRPAHAPAPAPVSSSAPTPAAGFAAPAGLSSSTSTTPQSTSPSFAGPSGIETSALRGGGYDDADLSRTGRGGTSTGTGPGTSPGTGLGTTPPPGGGQQVTGVPNGPGGGAGSTFGGPGHGGGPVSGREGGDSVLGKGKMVGSAPPAASANAQPGPGFSATRPPVGVGGMADGATAIGAGAMGGAVSGEQERRGRGFGRSTAAERGKAVRPLDVGELPEEEARRAEKANPKPPSKERTRAILEPAATQEAEEDAEHVRRYGVDDRDLFSDPREVSPDLIGEHAVPDDR